MMLTPACCCGLHPQVLPAFLEQKDLLQARLVCHAWRAAFSDCIKQVQLVQPLSDDAASRLGRNAAAEFPGATTLRIMLYHDERLQLNLGLTANEDKPVPGRQLDRPEGAIALLRQFTKEASLQELQLQPQYIGRFTGISRLLPLVPELRVLDLSDVYHESADLLVIAQHQPHLQQLVLHCGRSPHYQGSTSAVGTVHGHRRAATRRMSHSTLQR
jgi:hypothetical protein